MVLALSPSCSDEQEQNEYRAGEDDKVLPYPETEPLEGIPLIDPDISGYPGGIAPPEPEIITPEYIEKRFPIIDFQGEFSQGVIDGLYKVLGAVEKKYPATLRGNLIRIKDWDEKFPDNVLAISRYNDLTPMEESVYESFHRRMEKINKMRDEGATTEEILKQWVEMDDIQVPFIMRNFYPSPHDHPRSAIHLRKDYPKYDPAKIIGHELGHIIPRRVLGNRKYQDVRSAFRKATPSRVEEIKKAFPESNIVTSTTFAQVLGEQMVTRETNYFERGYLSPLQLGSELATALKHTIDGYLSHFPPDSEEAVFFKKFKQISKFERSILEHPENEDVADFFSFLVVPPELDRVYPTIREKAEILDRAMKGGSAKKK